MGTRRDNATPNAPSASAVVCIALEPESRLAATGHADGSISVWDVDSAESRTTIALHEGPVSAMLFATGGHQLITASDDRTVRSTDVAGEQSTILASSPGRVMRFIALCNIESRPFALCRSFDGSVLRVIDLGGDDEPVEIRSPPRHFLSGVLLPDLNVLGLTENGALEFWSAGQDDPQTCIETGLETPRQVAVSEDGAIVAVGDAIGTVSLWDRERSSPLSSVTAPPSGVRSIALDESGTYLASVGHDGSLRVAAPGTPEAVAHWNERRDVACCALTSRLLAREPSYRAHARSLAAVLAVVGTDSGDVEFIECGGLGSRWHDRE